MIKLVLGTVLGIILLTAVLMPTIDNAVNPDNVLYKNTMNGPTAMMISDGDSGTISIESNAVVITINDEPQTYTTTSQIQPLMGENVIFNHNANAAVGTLYYLSNGSVTTVSNLTSIGWEVSGDDLTITPSSGDPVTIPVGKTLAWGDNGGYKGLFKQNGSTAYYSESDPFYLFLSPGVYLRNTVCSVESYTVTTNSQLVSSTQNVYSMTYSNAALTITDENSQTVGTGIWAFASKEVHGLGAEKVDEPIKDIMNVIPILMVAAILVSIVAVFVNRAE